MQLLCVDDEADDAALIALALERSAPGRFKLAHVEGEAAFRRALANRPDAILCDYSMPGFSPHAALEILAARHSEIPLIVVTHSIGEAAAVHVLRCGACDYVTKDRLPTLAGTIERVVADQRRRQEKERLERELHSAYDRLKKVSGQLVASQERERRLVSHELHEQLGQMLASIVMHLNAAHASAQPATWRHYTDTALQLANQAMQQVRTLSAQLSPVQLDILGLAAALEAEVRRIAEPAGVRWWFGTRGRAEPGSQVADAAVLALVRDMVGQAARSDATAQVAVRLRYLAGGRLALLVAQTDGVLPVTAAAARQHSGAGTRLGEIVVRAELAGAQVRMRQCGPRSLAVRLVI